jgi:hypothetical protein
MVAHRAYLGGLPAGRRQAASAAVTEGDNLQGAMGRTLDV